MFSVTLIFHQTARSCFLPLGMESGHLPDSAISASTSYDANHIPQFGRLNKIPASGKAGAWCAKSNDVKQWLQVSFGQQTTVTKVATQGRHKYNQWVTSYTLSYSVDGAHWVWYRLSNGHIKVWLTCNGISGKSCSIRNQTMHLTFNIHYISSWIFENIIAKIYLFVKQFFSAINSKVANVKLRVQPLLFSLLLISFSSPFHRDFSMRKITRKH